MSRSIEKALADCLERMEADGATLEEALSLYPELRAELESLLSLSAELDSLPKIAAPASLRGYKRPVFRPVPARPGISAWWRWLLGGGRSYGWSAPLARMAVALGIFVAASGGAVVASANSLPDEPLYSVKIAVESAELALAPNDQARAALELKLATRRLKEVEVAAQQGRSEAVVRGAQLYKEKADAAIEAARHTGTADTQVEESIRQNQVALEQVLEKLTARDAGNSAEHSNAVNAIQNAMSASAGQGGPSAGQGGPKDKEPKDKDTKEKDADKGAKPEKQSQVAEVAPTPTPTTAATPTATPTAIAEPTRTNEPPGKATGRPDQPGNSGQPANQGVAQEKGQGAATQGHPSSEAPGQGPAARDADSRPTATATPTEPAIQPAGRGQGAENKPGNDPQPKGNAQGKDKKGAGAQEDSDMLSNFLNGLQSLMGRR